MNFSAQIPCHGGPPFGPGEILEIPTVFPGNYKQIASCFGKRRQRFSTDETNRSGFYLSALALGFVSGSTFITLVVLLGLIPAHIFFLKYFEELELELRFGEPYKEYKQAVPF